MVRLNGYPNKGLQIEGLTNLLASFLQAIEETNPGFSAKLPQNLKAYQERNLDQNQKVLVEIMEGIVREFVA